MSTKICLCSWHWFLFIYEQYSWNHLVTNKLYGNMYCFVYSSVSSILRSKRMTQVNFIYKLWQYSQSADFCIFFRKFILCFTHSIPFIVNASHRFQNHLQAYICLKMSKSLICVEFCWIFFCIYLCFGVFVFPLHDILQNVCDQWTGKYVIRDWNAANPLFSLFFIISIHL